VSKKWLSAANKKCKKVIVLAWFTVLKLFHILHRGRFFILLFV